jgi:hypothetical protein
MSSPDLAGIVYSAPTLTDTAARFDLRTASKGILYALTGGTEYEVVEAPISNADNVDFPFRTAARSGGVVLVIAGVGLHIDPTTGSYDLAGAAAAGNLTAAKVRAQS